MWVPTAAEILETADDLRRTGRLADVSRVLFEWLSRTVPDLDPESLFFCGPVWLTLAENQMKNSEIVSAVESLQQAESAGMDITRQLFLGGCQLAESGDAVSGRDWLKAAVSRHPDQSFLARQLGCLLLDCGELTSGIQWLGWAEQLEVETLSFPLRAGDLLAIRGHYSAAVSAWVQHRHISHYSPRLPDTQPMNASVRDAIAAGSMLTLLLEPDNRVALNEDRYREQFQVETVHGFGQRFWAVPPLFDILHTGLATGFAYPSDRRFFVRYGIALDSGLRAALSYRHGSQYAVLVFRLRQAFRPIWCFGQALDFDSAAAAVEEGGRFRMQLEWADGRWLLLPVILVFAHVDSRRLTVRTAPFMLPSILWTDPADLEPFVEGMDQALSASDRPYNQWIDGDDSVVSGQYVVCSDRGLIEQPSGTANPGPPSLIRLEYSPPVS